MSSHSASVTSKTGGMHASGHTDQDEGGGAKMERKIAHVAGVPIGTVMSRLARGRRQLSAALAVVPGESS